MGKQINVSQFVCLSHLYLVYVFFIYSYIQYMSTAYKLRSNIAKQMKKYIIIKCIIMQQSFAKY
jgi:hypothetical protein